MALIMAMINTLSLVIQTVCLVVIAFELSPWERRKDKVDGK